MENKKETKRKIGIDLNTRYLETKNSEGEIKKYIEDLRNYGVSNLDLIMDYVLNEYNSRVLELIKEAEMTISIHSNPIDGVYTTFEDLDSVRNSIDIHYNKIKDIDKILRSKGFNNIVPIIYHAGKVTKDRNIELSLSTKFFKGLAEKVKGYNFEILTETLSLNHPKGDNIGNCWEDFLVLNENIKEDNWGICWDTGHTRLNSVEEGNNLYPPLEIVDKIKFTHIHDINFKDSAHHLPIVEGESQDNEIKLLIINEYQGHYSLEYDFRYTDNSNQDNVLFSIYRLKELVNYLGNNRDTIELEEEFRREDYRVYKNYPILVEEQNKVHIERGYSMSISSIRINSNNKNIEKIKVPGIRAIPVNYIASRNNSAIYKIQTDKLNLEEKTKLVDFVF